MDMNFKDKTALVTGTGAGIGRDLVRRLIELGANVIAVSQTQEKLDSLKAELASDRLTTVCVDLGNWHETEEKLAPLCKKVDFLVNNAGYAYCCPLEVMPQKEVDKTLDINLKAPINLTRLVAGGMKERRFGSIVNVSSVAALVAADDHIVYAASKAGLDMVTKVSAKELAPFNIRVNSINPTVVWTAMGQKNWGDPAKKAIITARIPMNRFVEIREVLEPILFLLSDASTMMTGTTIPIDGGLSAT